MHVEEALHVFIQGMMQNLSIPESAAKDLIEELTEATRTNQDLEPMLTEANLALQPLNINIVKTRHPRSEHWVLSIIYPETAETQDLWRAISQEKFIELVNSFFSKKRNYERTLKQLTGPKINEGDVLAFLDEGWIEECEDRSFIPTAKLLYQGEKFLADNCEDGNLFKCLGCEKFVLFGRFCQTGDCPGCTHRRCDRPYRQKENLNADVCPLCNGTFGAANNEE